MTRPKRLRRAEKRARQSPFAAYPVLARARVPISPTYTFEIELYNVDGVHTLVRRWHPCVPKEAEMAKLQERLDEELAPFLALAESKSGLPISWGLRIKIESNPFAALPVIMEARTPVSEKYTLELTLHEVPSGDCALWIGWDPHPPSMAEELAFEHRIDAALAPFFDVGFGRPRHSPWGGPA